MIPESHLLFQDDPFVFNELTKMSALPNFKSDITMQRDSEEDNRILIPITDQEAHASYYAIYPKDKKQFYQPLLKQIKDKLLMYVEKNPQIYVVLSHTCPYKYLPREVFMKGINPLKVDYSTEFFLDKLELSLDYKKWYCGHFHTDKKIDCMIFMFNEIVEF